MKEKDIILYVDDEETNLRIFRTSFRREYNVLLATSGKEAIKLLAENEVKILITDQKMPEMTGTQLLESTVDDYPDIIRIILTGFSDIESIIKAVNKAGIYKYITKPYDRGEMKLTLDKALENFNLKSEKNNLIQRLQQSNEELEKKVQERTEQLTTAYQKVTSSIQYAQRIQKAMLPDLEFFKGSFNDFFLIYKPKNIVSGDFYSFIKVENQDTSIIAMVDCTGHGVPGAFMSMIGDSLLNTIIIDKGIYQPDLILKHLDEGVQTHLQQELTENKDGMVASIVTINRSKQKLYFSGARQAILYVDHHGDLQIIKGEKISVGWESKRIQDITYKTHTLELNTVDTFYLFSDGFQDQFGGEHDKKIGLNLLKEMITDSKNLPLDQQKQKILEILNQWMNTGKKNPQTDDITIMGIKI